MQEKENDYISQLNNTEKIIDECIESIRNIIEGSKNKNIEDYRNKNYYIYKQKINSELYKNLVDLLREKRNIIMNKFDISNKTEKEEENLIEEYYNRVNKE